MTDKRNPLDQLSPEDWAAIGEGVERMAQCIRRFRLGLQRANREPVQHSIPGRQYGAHRAKGTQVDEQRARSELVQADYAELEARVMAMAAQPYELFDVFGVPLGRYDSLPAATGAATMKGVESWAVYKHGTLVQYREK